MGIQKWENYRISKKLMESCFYSFAFFSNGQTQILQIPRIFHRKAVLGRFPQNTQCHRKNDPFQWTFIDKFCPKSSNFKWVRSRMFFGPVCVKSFHQWPLNLHQMQAYPGQADSTFFCQFSTNNSYNQSFYYICIWKLFFKYVPRHLNSQCDLWIFVFHSELIAFYTFLMLTKIVRPDGENFQKGKGRKMEYFGSGRRGNDMFYWDTASGIKVESKEYQIKIKNKQRLAKLNSSYELVHPFPSPKACKIPLKSCPVQSSPQKQILISRKMAYLNAPTLAIQQNDQKSLQKASVEAHNRKSSVLDQGNSNFSIVKSEFKISMGLGQGSFNKQYLYDFQQYNLIQAKILNDGQFSPTFREITSSFFQQFLDIENVFQLQRAFLSCPQLNISGFQRLAIIGWAMELKGSLDKITKYNKMWKIINFKEIIYQQGAFFDSVALSLKVDTLDIAICDLKSHQFIFNPRQNIHSKKIGVRLKVPNECRKLELKVHARIVNLETTEQTVPLQLARDGQNVTLDLDVDTELGSFGCKLGREEEKYMKRVYKCEGNSDSSDQSSEDCIKDKMENPTDGESASKNTNGIKLNFKQNLDIQKTVKLSKNSHSHSQSERKEKQRLNQREAAYRKIRKFSPMSPI